MPVVRQLVAGLRFLLVMTVLLGLLYPAVVTLFAQLAVPASANGSLVAVDGRTVGSALLGQRFDGPEWFQPRPSASDYSGRTSGGSNLSPVSAAQTKAVAGRAADLHAANPDAVGAVPADALTASGSGLDPGISVDYALWQVPRVAKARGLEPSVLRTLIAASTDPAWLGFVGQDSVNVTRLNAALAAQK